MTDQTPSSPVFRSWIAIAIVLLAATAVIAPFPIFENASGHDIAFHIQSWMETARQWHEGVVYPRWAAWANFGYGEPRFIFYPPISWVVGAALGRVLEWRMVPGALIWLALILSAAGMFRLAREWLSPRDSLAAAVLYMVNPYQIVLVYYRSDFAELAAAAIFPWLLWRAARIERAGTRGVIWLAATFAAIWLSNAPAAVITSYALVLILIVQSVACRSPRILARGCAAMAAGFGLAAFYIVPAAYEQRWVQIHQAIGPGLRPEINFLFTRSNDPDFQLFNWKVSSVAIGMMLAAAIAMAFAMRRKREMPGAWRALAALGCVSAALMFPFSGIVWRLLPKLEFVQFPWRWLMPLGAVFAFFTAAAVAERRKKWMAWIALAILICSTAVAVGRDAWWDSEDIPQVETAIQSGAGYEGTDEYQPIDCDHTDLPVDVPQVAVISAPIDRIANLTKFPASEINREANVHIERWMSEDRTISVDTPQPSTLIFRLLDYPAWRAKLDGHSAQIRSMKNTRQILLSIPAGKSQIELRFARTADRRIGGGISLATALVLGLLFFLSQPTSAITEQSPSP